jgi:hypothetical protein
VHKPEPVSTWLEPVLRRGLGKVAAPRELWDRITLPRVEMRAGPSRTFLWMITGASVVTASLLAVAWGYYPTQRVEFKSDHVAGREASTPSGQYDMPMACLGCHVNTTI